MKYTCNNCENIIEIKQSRLLKNKSTCCSKKCAVTLKLKSQKKEDKCCVCNKDIHLKPYHKKKYKGPFSCSRVCRGIFLKSIYTGKNNPKLGYTDGNIVFCCSGINKLKGNYDIKEFLYFIEQLKTYGSTNV
jgi:hypothetical protein